MSKQCCNFHIYTQPRKVYLCELFAFLTSINVFEPETVSHEHVLKSKTQVESPSLHSQLLYINDYPLVVLKLMFLASIVTDVTGSTIEQFSKYHSVSSFYVSSKLTFSSYHHPLQVYYVGTATGSTTLLLANV